MYAAVSALSVLYYYYSFHTQVLEWPRGRAHCVQFPAQTRDTSKVCLSQREMCRSSACHYHGSGQEWHACGGVRWWHGDHLVKANALSASFLQQAAAEGAAVAAGTPPRRMLNLHGMELSSSWEDNNRTTLYKQFDQRAMCSAAVS